MAEAPRPTKQTGLAKRLVDKTRALHNAQSDIKRLERDLKEAQEVIGALTSENLALGKLVKDYQARFTNGGIVYTINNGYVSSVVELPEYSEYTYKQPYNKEIGTVLYNTFPFVKVEDRAFMVDTEQYKKYKGAIK